MTFQPTPAKPTFTVIAEYEQSGQPRTVKDFTAHLRSASTHRTGAGLLPLRRMSGPGALHRSGTEADGRNTVPMYRRGTTLMLDVPGLAPQKFTPAALRVVMDSPRFLLMPLDAADVQAAEKMCRAATDDDERSLGQVLAVLRRMVVSSKMLILTDALDRTFYRPDDVARDDVSGWAQALCVSDDPDGWRVLAAHALSAASDANQPYVDERGVTSVRHYLSLIQQAEDKMQRTVLGRRSSVAASAGLALAETVEQMWSTVTRIDPLLITPHLMRGEVVQLSSTQWTTPGLAGVLSTPSKVKVGEVLALMGNRIVNTTLSDLGFDPTQQALVGVFRTGSNNRGGRSGRHAVKAGGRTILEDMHTFTGPIYLTAAPIPSRQMNSTAKWSIGDESKMADLPGIAMPLDIAVAGGPVED